jgi:hypothetical protein
MHLIEVGVLHSQETIDALNTIIIHHLSNYQQTINAIKVVTPLHMAHQYPYRPVRKTIWILSIRY